MSVLRPEIGKIGIGTQADKNTEAVEPRKQFRWTGGQLQESREEADQKSGDGKKWGTAISLVQLVSNGGEIQHMGVVEHYAYAAANLFGNDTVSSGPHVSLKNHTIDSSTDEGKWVSAWRELGTGTVNFKTKFVGAKITGLVYSASAGSDSVNNITTTILGTDSKTYEDSFVPSDDPADDSAPFEWSHGSGQMKIGGVNEDNAICAVNQLEISIQTGEEGWQGCSNIFYDVVGGDNVVEINGTLLIDDTTKDLFNLYHYGSANPVAGTKPSKKTYQAPFQWANVFGDYDGSGNVIANANMRKLSWDFAEVHYTLEDLPEFSADSGPAEIAFTGVAHATEVDELLTIVATTPETTNYLDVAEPAPEEPEEP